MTKVISFFNRKDDDVLRNHTHYASTMGYAHDWVETSFLSHPKLRIAYKYSYLLEQLKSVSEGDVVLLLDEHSAVFRPVDLNHLMNGRDSVIVEGPTEQNKPNLPFSNMIGLRNTPAIRETLFEIIMALHSALTGKNDQLEEEFLLNKFDVLAINTALEGTYINVSWRIAHWFEHAIFVVHLGPNMSIGDDGKLLHDAFHQLTHDANFEKVLFKQINGTLIDGLPLLQAPNYPAISDDAVSHFNPNSKIALVTLYTHHIATYARVSEHNVKRYCDRHGYAYHVYREVPSEIDPSISGSWVRSWLLQNLVSDHEWVIWIDADVLFRNQNIKLETILEGRDLLFAKDLCAWPINSGVLGFRNTPANIELIAAIWQRMTEIGDKSTTYSDQGDQHHTIKVLYEQDLIHEKSITSALPINTPPPMSSPNTLLTHYVGISEPYRSVYMAVHDAESQQQSS